MLDKKEIWVILLFKFKIGPNEVETTWNINNILDLELPTKVQCSGGSRSFAK